jgi:hypothetical protein
VISDIDDASFCDTITLISAFNGDEIPCQDFVFGKWLLEKDDDINTTYLLNIFDYI